MVLYPDWVCLCLRLAVGSSVIGGPSRGAPTGQVVNKSLVTALALQPVC